MLGGESVVLDRIVSDALIDEPAATSHNGAPDAVTDESQDPDVLVGIGLHQPDEQLPEGRVTHRRELLGEPPEVALVFALESQEPVG